MPIKKPLLENEQLFFIHIPKCAGTTFLHIIDQRYLNTEILPVHNNLKQLRDQFSDRQLAGYKLLRGHIPYDQLIPRLPTIPRLITFLRNPLDQFISYFQMRQRVDNTPGSLRAPMAHLTPEQFMDRPELVNHFANNATRQIGGILKHGQGKLTPNLERAKERLATFDFVGLTERFDESLELFSYVLNFEPISSYETLNVSPEREKRKGLQPALLERVAEIQQYDLELYKFGAELFQNMREKMQQEKAAGTPPVTQGAPVQKAHVDFARVEPGMGWYMGEADPFLGCTRWSGPEETSYLHLHLAAQSAYAVRFKVLWAAKPDILRSLTLEANGLAIPLKATRNLLGATTFEGQIPAAAIIPQKATILAFKVNRTAPIRFHNFKREMLARLGRPMPTPSRYQQLLGLCYQWLDISPA